MASFMKHKLEWPSGHLGEYRPKKTERKLDQNLEAKSQVSCGLNSLIHVRNPPDANWTLELSKKRLREGQ